MKRDRDPGDGPNPAEKQVDGSDLLPADPGRRSFLIGCCQAGLFIPAALRGWPFSFEQPSVSAPAAAPGEFFVRPKYRSQLPLEAVLRHVQPGFDAFITEKYAAQVEAILRQWASGLLNSPTNVRPIQQALAEEFLGTPLGPVESRLVRAAPPVEVRQQKFSARATLRADAFLREWQASMSSFSKLMTAEFQVTRVDASGMSSGPPSGELRTRVRYELVGSGRGFHREQRVGSWELTWKAVDGGEFRLSRWEILDETRSRAATPVFADISTEAFAANRSYSAQLLKGTDYWRTVLDGACGIDIYGHNGVSAGDIDGDGLDDLYICQPAGLPNRLYRNRGDGTFEDVTEASGVGVLENTACALFIDIDNDGRQDLVVVRANGPMLFLNQGGGKFRQKSGAFQFGNPPQGTFTGAAAADYDGDGWLDIYFCLYLYYQGTDQYKYPMPYYDAENGPPNFLMRNHRDGTFRDVTREAGLDRNNNRFSFCCAWNDYNGDGRPDLYVVNDFGRKNLYRNNGDGTFTDVGAEEGVEDVGAGMSVCWLDYDDDGAPDLYVADMWTAAGERITMQEVFKKNSPAEVRALYHKHAMGNSLFRNCLPLWPSVSSVVTKSSSTTEGTEDHGGGPFQDVTAAAGAGLGRWAWSSDAWDFDRDGFPDLYVANGMISGTPGDDLNSFFWRQVVANSPDGAKPSHDYEQAWNAINELIRSDATWSGFERNVFYANNRDGTFSDVSGAVGMDFLEDARAFALADFDQDGRQEVLLKNRNAPQVRLLKDIVEDLPPAIAFRLRGTSSNRDAIGAVITIQSDATRQKRMLQAGSGFLSQHSKEMFFGLGNSKGPVRATIRWPGGLVQELRDLPVNHRVWVEEGKPEIRVEAFKPFSAPQIATTGEREAAALQFVSPSSIETLLLAPVSAPEFSLPDAAGKNTALSGLRGKPVLLNFWVTASPDCQKDLELFNQRHARWESQGLQLLTVNFDGIAGAASAPASKRSFPVLRGSEDVAAVYSIVFRYLFDRHRDLPVPVSFLIDEGGDIVRVYQGALNPQHVEEDFRHIPRSTAERMAWALPFPAITDTVEFGRNYLSYGSVFFQRGYFEQAEAAFSRAQRDDPESAEALYGLGSVYLNQQKTAQARESFERVVKLRGNYPDTIPNAWNNLGLLAAREGHTEEAIGYFQQALRLSPDHSIALVNLASAYRQLKRWDDAQQVLQHALAIRPDNPEANYGLAMVYAQRDDTDHAYEYLQQALKSRPDYPEALNNLGILYLRTQRPEQAITTFEECIRVAPAYDQAYLNLARVYAIEGQNDKARALLLELLKQHPGHAAARNALAELPK